jgi:hypothetical protein
MVLADYGTAAEWIVGAGTLLLAGATFWLALKARAQVEVAADHVVAIQRPLVTPIVTTEWLNLVRGQAAVALKNVGLGPAYNIEGGLYWTGGAGGASSLQRTTLAAREESNVWITAEGANVVWENASGFLRYFDSAGEEWVTHFRYQRVPIPGMEVLIEEIGTTAELGEPRYSPEGRAPS